MRILSCIVILAAAAVVLPVQAAERSFQTSATIPAPIATVWQAMTTAEGWKRMGVPFVVMDFRVGGVIESSYTDKAVIGDPNNIKNEVVAYLPGRMLAVKNIQAPKSFPYPKEFATTVTVFELAPEGPTATKITATGVGFGEGKGYDWLLDAFEKGDAWALDQLRKSFGGVAASKAEVDRMSGSFEKK
jgi:uncharacterized protein YndB with AHSA1/START domain